MVVYSFNQVYSYVEQTDYWGMQHLIFIPGMDTNCNLVPDRLQILHIPVILR